MITITFHLIRVQTWSHMLSISHFPFTTFQCHLVQLSPKTHLCFPQPEDLANHCSIWVDDTRKEMIDAIWKRYRQNIIEVYIFWFEFAQLTYFYDLTILFSCNRSSKKDSLKYDLFSFWKLWSLLFSQLSVKDPKV